MTEKQLISKIQELRQIKPNEDWVISFKKELIGQEKKSYLSLFFQGERFVFHHKLAFAVLLVFIVLIGVFGFAQNSVPGEALFQLKKITENSQAVFVSEKDQPKHNLETANKRLDDLFKITQENEINNLAPAINEYQESVSKAANSLANAEIGQEIINQVKKLEQKEEQIKSLGIEIGEGQELNNVLAKLVEREMQDLQGGILEQVKQDYDAGDYSAALEKILLSQ